VLRRQARDPIEKPLIVLTPKSLLRNPRCVSTLAELAEGSFSEVVDDETTAGRHVRRVLLTSGKLFYELAAKREQLHVNDVALVRIEQLYPFPGPGLASVLTRYPDNADLVWVQEEPKNMGAWRFLRDRFLEGEVPGLEGRPLRYLGRRPSAAPAPGTLRAHQREQDAILAAAFE
jgi:2-oxoglutarate dehydrogenase E1 component